MTEKALVKKNGRLP